MPVEFQRQRLYEAIWEVPLGQIAARCGLAASAIRSMCADMGIPRPPIGYWAARRGGREVPVLPLLPGEYPTVVVIHHARPNRWGVTVKADSPPAQRPLPLGRIEEQPRIATPKPTPRFIPLKAWAELMFGEYAPHSNTLLRCVHEGRIQPQPIKVGKNWFVKPDAMYVAD
jgi:hypothetical protein